MANIEDKFNLVLLPFREVTRSFHPSAGLDQPGLPIKRKAIGDAEAWKERVRRDIDTLSKTNVGLLFLKQLGELKGKILIRPGFPGHCNSVAGQGRKADLLNELGDVHFDADSLAEVLYYPLTYSIMSSCSQNNIDKGGFHVESNEVLLHELVHAFRHATGKLDKQSFNNGLAFYEDNEEFNAVLMQGIYASERKTPVRESHFGKIELNKEFDTSITFFKQSKDTFLWVGKFCSDHPKFTRSLANIRLKFNPIRAYYLSSPQAKRMVRTTFAKERDKLMPPLKAAVMALRQEMHREEIRRGK